MDKKKVDHQLLSKLDSAIDSGTLNQVHHALNNLSPPDIADQLETAPPKLRRILWELIEDEISGEVLHELSDDIQSEFLKEMDSSEVASLTEGLDVDDYEVVRDHLAALLASLLRRIGRPSSSAFSISPRSSRNRIRALNNSRIATKSMIEFCTPRMYASA